MDHLAGAGSLRPAGQPHLASKAIADATALGNFRWDIQPACTGIGQNCALNRQLLPRRQEPAHRQRHAARARTPPSLPWAVWQEFDGQAWQIFVSRFDGTNWILVGDSLVFRFDNAETPDIYFVGNVPHVAWVEQQGGFKLCSTPPGRHAPWPRALGPGRRLRHQHRQPADLSALRGSATSPMVAWQENIFFNPSDLSASRPSACPMARAWEAATVAVHPRHLRHCGKPRSTMSCPVG
ncbi:MAG: hypothetical protein U0641_11815 [Anaerolineae bacterium]